MMKIYFISMTFPRLETTVLKFPDNRENTDARLLNKSVVLFLSI